MSLTPVQTQEATTRFVLVKEEELQKALGNRLAIIAQTVLSDILTKTRFHVFNEAQLRHEINRAYAEKAHMVAAEHSPATGHFICRTGLILAICNTHDSDAEVWVGRVTPPLDSIRARPNRELEMLVYGRAPITMVSLEMIMDFQNRRRENPGTWRDPAPDQVIGTTFCDADFKPIDC
jgi:hypothetical protein